MPIECAQLDGKQVPKYRCPRCGTVSGGFMRGQVQRSKRFLWILWRQPYCAVICHTCKDIIGWEAP
jgi:hypothetical protein